MTNLEQLLSGYHDDARILALTQALDADPAARIQCIGLKGGLESIVIAAANAVRPGYHLVIANDKEEAAYLQNDLAALYSETRVHFFPDSFKRPLYFEVLQQSNVLQRTETVDRITNLGKESEIVVTYPEALFEQVVNPSVLAQNRLVIKQDEQVDVDTLIGVLNEFGFKREDFVYEPGQYSIRGGIVDIFSYGNDLPYRIELFDEDVESIRTFNPETQLSAANIRRLSIVPNINTRFEQDQKVSLFHVLPDNAVLWVRDFQYLLDQLQTCFEKAGEFADTVSILDERDLAEIFRDRAFIRPAQVMDDVYARPLVALGGGKMNKDLLKGEQQHEPVRIQFEGKPQPSFNKNFKLLIENLEKNTKEGLTNYLFASNPKQLERFYAIFKDMNAKVEFHPIPLALHAGYVDYPGKVAAYTDHQIFQRFHRPRLKGGFSKDTAMSTRMLRELKPGDFVVHIDHGVGRYSGLEKIEVNGQIQESVRLFYKNNDVLYVGINSLHKISKHTGKEGTPPALSKIGSDAWSNLKRRAKKKVKDMAGELIKLYAERKATPGHAFPPDGYLQNELESSFMYEDTPDQLTATQEVKEDMIKAHPMDRLICGDVGFGKTEIAVRGAFKAVVDGKQVAVLVPTTILALQHAKTFKERLAEFGVTVDYVNRFRTAKEKTAIYKRLEKGEIDILIGTHAILNKRIKFKDLGLLIIDEEQKFGVAAKEKLRAMKVNVDTLTLTATPIPRTLQFSLMAARDLSIIRTPPPNRQPIHTEIRVFNDELIKESIYYEINRGGQVFFVHNRVKSLGDITAMVRRLCPDVDVASAHGQMDSKELERVLLGFIDKKYDVLVCTNIIETGLDIPNANTMIINNAHQFGMSDLHQLRGRIGRSNKKAYCYLFCPPLSTLTTEARKRMRTIEEFSDLGSGFDIAMKDLDIRGAGNLLGGEQSGFITDIGYETYQKILQEAIAELKEGKFKDVFKEDLEKQKIFVRDVQIDTDVEMLIPDAYVRSIQERLNLYTRLDKLETEEGLAKFEAELLDRFGKIPKEVNELFNGVRLRWICKELGFERVILKNRKLRCYFVENPQSAFYDSEIFQTLFMFIGAKGDSLGVNLKKSARHLILVKDNIKTLTQAQQFLVRLKQKAGVGEEVAA